MGTQFFTFLINENWWQNRAEVEGRLCKDFNFNKHTYNINQNKLSKQNRQMASNTNIKDCRLKVKWKRINKIFKLPCKWKLLNVSGEKLQNRPIFGKCEIISLRQCEWKIFGKIISKVIGINTNKYLLKGNHSFTNFLTFSSNKIIHLDLHT